MAKVPAGTRTANIVYGPDGGIGGSIRRWATAAAPSDYLGLRLARSTCEAVSALAARMAGIDGFARFPESRCCRPGHAGQQQEAGVAGAERSGGEAHGLDDRTIFETLLQRERLGSTGIGEGLAIPHGKLPKLDRLFGLVARLEKPIDFEALDGQPVDVLFLLLAPEGAGADHLKALARVARVLREPGILERIRATRDADALYAVMTGSTTPRAA